MPYVINSPLFVGDTELIGHHSPPELAEHIDEVLASLVTTRRRLLIGAFQEEYSNFITL